jgi:hypothetical protein
MQNRINMAREFIALLSTIFASTIKIVLNNFVTTKKCYCCPIKKIK